MNDREEKRRGTPRFNHKPINMERRPDEDGFTKVGQFSWGLTPYRVLIVAIPHLSPSGWILTEWTIDHKNECGASWAWDGNEDKPTLTPSIHAVGMYHGRITSGQLIEA